MQHSPIDLADVRRRYEIDLRMKHYAPLWLFDIALFKPYKINGKTQTDSYWFPNAVAWLANRIGFRRPWMHIVDYNAGVDDTPQLQIWQVGEQLVKPRNDANIGEQDPKPFRISKLYDIEKPAYFQVYRERSPNLQKYPHPPEHCGFSPRSEHADQWQCDVSTMSVSATAS